MLREETPAVQSVAGFIFTLNKLCHEIEMEVICRVGQARRYGCLQIPVLASLD